MGTELCFLDCLKYYISKLPQTSRPWYYPFLPVDLPALSSSASDGEGALSSLAGAGKVDEGLLPTVLQVYAKSGGGSEEYSLKTSMLGNAASWWF